MPIKLYPTPGGFLRDNAAFLHKYEAQSQLNRGNAAAHMDEPCSPALLFGRVELDNEPVLLFGNTPPWNLCLNAAPGDGRIPEAAAGLAAYFRENSIAITGVSGRDGLCRAFIEAHGGSFTLRSAMDIMVLEKLIEPAPIPGKVRPARAGDLDTIVRWALAFYREALNETASSGDLYQRNTERIKSGGVRLFEMPSGTLVSMAHTSRETERGISISGVYTPPEHRGRGYCQNTVAALCRDLLADRKDYVTLFVDKKNPISNRVYRKIGFDVLEDASDYRLV